MELLFIIKKNYKKYWVLQNDVMMGDRVVDINVATVEDLETLVGVGRAKAEAIVTTRNVSV